jgi:hypothetical protein
VGNAFEGRFQRLYSGRKRACVRRACDGVASAEHFAELRESARSGGGIRERRKRVVERALVLEALSRRSDVRGHFELPGDVRSLPGAFEVRRRGNSSLAHDRRSDLGCGGTTVAASKDGEQAVVGGDRIASERNSVAVDSKLWVKAWA